MFLVLELENGKHPPSAGFSRVKTRLRRVLSHPQKEVVISVLRLLTKVVISGLSKLTKVIISELPKLTRVVFES